MTPAEALRDIQGYASANRILYRDHALLRMRQRGASKRDVQRALAYATACTSTETCRWKVIGLDTTSDELVAIVEILDGIIVVTIY